MCVRGGGGVVCVRAHAFMCVCMCAGPLKCPGPFLTWNRLVEELGKLLGQG